jgi:hypothetical protein
MNIAISAENSFSYKVVVGNIRESVFQQNVNK